MDITKITLENNAYRKIIQTSTHMQLVIMSLLPNEDIPLETHDAHDQFFNIVAGQCLIEADGQSYKLDSGMIMIVKAGSPHYIKNLSRTDKLKLYTIYSPAEHPDGLVQELKTSPYPLEKSQSGGSVKEIAQLYKKYKLKYIHLKQIGGTTPTIWKV